MGSIAGEWAGSEYSSGVGNLINGFFNLIYKRKSEIIRTKKRDKEKGNLKKEKKKV